MADAMLTEYCLRDPVNEAHSRVAAGYVGALHYVYVPHA